MKMLLALLSVLFLTGLSAQQTIPLASFDKDATQKGLALQKGSEFTADSLLVSAGQLYIEVMRSKGATGYRYVEVTVTYDDLNSEHAILRLDSLSADTTFIIPLEWATGRRVKSIHLSTSNRQGTTFITGVAYKPGGEVALWDEAALRGTGFADKDNTLQNGILVISSPIDNPPHLTSLTKPKVRFVASLAKSDEEALSTTGTITLYIVNLAEDEVTTRKFTVSGTPKTYTLDLSGRDMTYGYLVTFQPLPGQPWVAIRSMEVLPE